MRPIAFHLAHFTGIVLLIGVAACGDGVEIQQKAELLIPVKLINDNVNTLSIDETSVIDVSGKGFLAGRTVGNTTVGASTLRAGGSYGGLGGPGNGAGLPGDVYGDFRDPNANVVICTMPLF